MGYTTEFVGQINLSRKLTMAEAKTLLEYNEDRTLIPKPNPGSHFQWAPNRELDAIGWDDGEKFYEYTPWLEWLCDWLHERGIAANGSLYFSGESTGDNGVIYVVDNVVTEHRAEKVTSSFRPIRLDELAKIALDQLASK